MNTIIINKILMHMLDFEHRKIYHSTSFVDLNETNLDYYHKKLEKALYASTIKELTVGSMHELILRSDKMIESDEQFIKQAHDLTDQLYKLGTVIEEMPNSNVLFVDCIKDGQKFIAILKLNYRTIPMSVVEDGLVRITKQQVLPMAGSAVDEAILINIDTKQLYLIEKKYTIDGKSDFYLNPQWIKGEEKLTDKQKFNTMKKVIRLVRITKQQVLPMAGSAVDEAILINIDTKQLYLIEKKYTIDGKSDFYLNPQWIKGEEKLTDKQKFNTMKKVIRKLDDVYNVSDGKALPLMKQEIQDKVVAHQPIKPIEIAKKVLEHDYQAQEESELMLKDLGIGEEDFIQTVASSAMDTCKLVLDEDIEVSLPIDEYLHGHKLEKRKEADGTYSVVFKDISEVIVK